VIVNVEIEFMFLDSDQLANLEYLLLNSRVRKWMQISLLMSGTALIVTMHLGIMQQTTLYVLLLPTGHVKIAY
jgi:hypothetical protein